MRYLCFVIFLFVFNEAFCQKENNRWNFGNLGSLDFNTGIPVATFDSKLSSYEGSTSASDSTGHLLFYSDGITVWTKHHLPMVNGTGLMGDLSASQSALAVPKPGSATSYYLFTVDSQENNLQNGLRYSVIDLLQDNGNGAVSNIKNVLLETPVTEQLAAVQHGNGEDYWILVRRWNSNVISAYLLTNSGIATIPVESPIGSIRQGNFINATGCMKASPSGKKLAAVNFPTTFELYDFNNLTGIVSNLQSSAPIFSNAYDVQFSPDESKIYGTADKNEIYQFDLTAQNVFSTGIQIATSESGGFIGALQLGPDNKIYKGRVFSEYLGVINEPNLRGTSCNYINNGIFLGGFVAQTGLTHRSITGLPNFPSGRAKINNFSFNGNCAGKPVSFAIPEFNSSFQVSWNFGDPGSGTLNFATDPSPVHIFNLPGTYTVTLTINRNGKSSNLTKSVIIDFMPDFYLGPDTILCETKDLILQAPEIQGVQYLWQDGKTNNNYLVKKTGTYILQAKFNNCVSIDSINVTFKTCETSGLLELKGIIPNIITPDNDGLNDKFDLSNFSANEFELVIFNRWGVKIYESVNYLNDWDGKDSSAGNYYYLIQDNKTGNFFKGWVEVIK